jgi:EAL domain-containing protein (putative c-di-GMP-specific phosphodiesterase class I)
VRWRHPERGIISPTEFIPLAEETGLIVPIGEWVLRTACNQARAWQRALHRSVRMAVNLSAKQFKDENLSQIVLSALDETGLDPKLLELELTEGTLMDDARRPWPRSSSCAASASTCRSTISAPATRR